MISISNIAKEYGDRTLFSNVSAQINLGDRCGLVGANGSGKTTLLNILSGDIEPSTGSVSIQKRLRVGVLKQDQYLYEDRKIIDVAMMGHHELWQAMEAKEALLANSEEDFDADKFAVLEEMIQLNDGYTAEARATKILEGLGLPLDVHEDKLSTLSGGFKLRVLLAQVLASSPDVLLLDEPTNHLDILSIRWLETFLKDFQGAVVVISHDHRFLDNVSNKILDVDYETVLMYTGNYSQFLDDKVAERERREKEISSREREISEHQKFVDRFRAKASKARQAQSKIRMIEKKSDALFTLPPSSRRYPSFRFDQQRASGREVLKVKGVKKNFGEKRVLNGVGISVERGDRLAIMGPNGIGKSTLLKIIMGELTSDEGEIEWGYETHSGYFPQDNKDYFKSSKETAEGWMWELCPGKDIGFVRAKLALMLFVGDESKKRLSALSGGESARLVFAKLSVLNPNVLVLDEPTNHLDLEAIEALVQGLKSFAGTLIFVSHDRWFVGELANRILEIKPQDILDYRGTYEEYVHFCGDDHLDVDRVVLKAKQEKKIKKKIKKTLNIEEKKNSEKEEGELWMQVDIVEDRIKEIDEMFADPDYYESVSPEETANISRERTELVKKLDDLTSKLETIEKLKEDPE